MACRSEMWSTPLNCDGEKQAEYKPCIPAGFRRLFGSHKELLAFESATRREEIEGILKNNSISFKEPEVKPCKSIVSKEGCSSLEEYLIKKRLNEAEQLLVMLYAARPTLNGESALMRKLKDLLMGDGSCIFTEDGYSLKLHSDDSKKGIILVIGTLISALRKLRVYVANLDGFCGYPLVVLHAPKPDVVVKAHCTKGFVNASLIEDITKVGTDIVVPHRGMIPVIPCENPIAVFEPGTLMVQDPNSSFTEEAPWDKSQLQNWHSIQGLSNEWMFPVHHVFQRKGMPPSKRECDEAMCHYDKQCH